MCDSHSLLVKDRYEDGNEATESSESESDDFDPEVFSLVFLTKLNFYFFFTLIIRKLL